MTRSQSSPGRLVAVAAVDRPGTGDAPGQALAGPTDGAPWDAGNGPASSDQQIHDRCGP